MIKLPSIKTIGIIALAILLIYCWGITRYALKQKEEKEYAQDERDQAVAIAANKTEETTFYINKYNQEVAKVKSTEISLDNVNRLIDTKDFEWLNKFENLKKKYQNLQQATSVNLSFRGDSIIKRTIYVPCADTVKLFRYYIHDEFNHIDAVVLDTPVFQLKAPVYIVNMWERKKIGLRIGKRPEVVVDSIPATRRREVVGLRIGRKEHFLEATTPNKLIRIDSLVHYTTGRRRK